MQPDIWNVIVIGAWNPAILTPDGIKKRLFDLPEETPIQLEVAIDRPGTFRAFHDGVVVSPSARHLDVVAASSNVESLLKAGKVAQVALKNLPETPVSAAGVNLRYSLKPMPDELFDLLRAPIDDVYSDAGFRIISSETARSLEVQPGVLNVEITRNGDGSGLLVFNFHYASALPDALSQWVGRIQEFVETSRKTLGFMGIAVQEGV